MQSRCALVLMFVHMVSLFIYLFTMRPHESCTSFACSLCLTHSLTPSHTPPLSPSQCIFIYQPTPVTHSIAQLYSYHTLNSVNFSWFFVFVHFLPLLLLCAVCFWLLLLFFLLVFVLNGGKTTKHSPTKCSSAHFNSNDNR